MAQTTTFDRCVFCFAPKEENGGCPRCGYASGLCDLPGWWLAPGSILRGRYVVGRNLRSSQEHIAYLGWDLEREQTVEITEYFPEGLVTRDITHCEDVVTVPGKEDRVEEGRQAFFEKAKLFYNCVSRVEEELMMDFFLRNNTCYYVIKRQMRPEF